MKYFLNQTQIYNFNFILQVIIASKLSSYDEIEYFLDKF